MRYGPGNRAVLFGETDEEKIRIILLLLPAVVFLVSAGKMVRQQIQHRKTVAVDEEAAQIARQQVTGLAEPSLTPASTPPPKPEEEELSEPLPEDALELAEINLWALREVNVDVVGWISIPGTAVSYPLMQGKRWRTSLRFTTFESRYDNKRQREPALVRLSLSFVVFRSI